jgi:hypothetical protein
VAFELVFFVSVSDDLHCRDNGTDSSVISIPLLAGAGVGTVFDWSEFIHRFRTGACAENTLLDYTTTAQVRTIFYVSRMLT